VKLRQARKLMKRYEGFEHRWSKYSYDVVFVDQVAQILARIRHDQMTRAVRRVERWRRPKLA